MNKINNLAEVVYQNNNKDHIENCVIEEMSELTKAVTKSRRGKEDIKNITEEIGHVMLMCNSLMKCYGIQELAIETEAEDAVNRMLKAKQLNIIL